VTGTSASFHSDRLDVGDLKLHYLATGDLSGQPVLFLHGGGLTAYTWVPVLNALHGSYRCLLPELRGHGDSDWSADGAYYLEHYAADVANLLASLDFEPCVVVGMSLGGQVAMKLASEGHDFRGLVLVDVGPTVSRQGGAEIRSFLEVHRYESFEAALDAARAFNPSRSLESLTVSLSHNMVHHADGSWTWKWDPRRYETLERRREQAEELWSGLSEVRCPVLIARGEHSTVFPAESAELTAAAFPDARLVTIPGAGHTVQGDNPAALASELDRFFGEVHQRCGATS
jgi:esterase